jgi:hypothetical protein
MVNGAECRGRVHSASRLGGAICVAIDGVCCFVCGCGCCRCARAAVCWASSLFKKGPPPRCNCDEKPSTHDMCHVSRLLATTTIVSTTTMTTKMSKSDKRQKQKRRLCATCL